MNPIVDIKRVTDGYQLGNLLATGLPPAQSRTLLLRARGMGTDQSAAVLGCSSQNIKQQMRTLFFKLNCSNAPALITRAFESGLLRILSLLLASYIALFGAVMDDDARRGRRDQPRGASRLVRRNIRDPHLLFWDEEGHRLLMIPEGTDHSHA